MLDVLVVSVLCGGKGGQTQKYDESEENGPENTSVGGFGLCSFRSHCDDWKWNTCREMTTRCKSKNRDRTRQRRVLLCEMKDFECYRL